MYTLCLGEHCTINGYIFTIINVLESSALISVRNLSESDTLVFNMSDSLEIIDLKVKLTVGAGYVTIIKQIEKGLIKFPIESQLAIAS